MSAFNYRTSEDSPGDIFTYPSYEHIKEYFTSDEWSTMSDYEKSSYRNILHNYMFMQSLDLNPAKPSFMTRLMSQATSSRTTKETDSSNNGLKESTVQIPKQTEESCSQQSKLTNEKKKKKKNKKKPKKVEDLFSEEQISFIIKLVNTQHGILYAYKECKRSKQKISTRKSPIPKQKKKTKTKECKPVKYIKTREGGLTDEENVTREVECCEEVNSSFIGGINEKDLIEKTRPIEMSPQKMEVDVENKSEDIKDMVESSEGSRIIERPRRSVQTQTVSPDCSPETSVLVFVSKFMTKKLESPVSYSIQEEDPQLKENRMKAAKKNCRTLQTQTADDEDMSIENISMVFSPDIATEKLEAREELMISMELDQKLEEDFDLNDFPAREKGDLKDHKCTQEERENETLPFETTSKIPSCSKDCLSDEQDVIGINNVNNKIKGKKMNSRKFVKGKNSKSTSEIETAIPARSKDITSDVLTKTYTQTKTKTSSIVNDKNQSLKENKTVSQEVSVTVLKEPENSENKQRRYPRRSVPIKNYAEPELLQDDEYIFCDGCDREYEGDCPVHGPHIIFADSYEVLVTWESCFVKNWLLLLAVKIELF